ncbi:hypothetical protein [Anaerostipes sp.]|jgi:hypothetical protein|uniref:hypothetical protein n=1 Tax=Anaerostipes sp. TaxID=1872530 RepID=UPI003966B99C
MKKEDEIKAYADKLCRKYSGVSIYKIAERKERIIKELMYRYNINYDYAEYCFWHNKERRIS